jgi:hypothetical protein
MEKCAETFQGPLAPGAITELRAAMRLVNNQCTEAAVVLIGGELAAQINLAA